MPNDYVDLGYHSRTLWSSDPALAGNQAESETNGQLHIQDQYNRIKTAMEAENSGQNWEVGRLFLIEQSGQQFLGWVIKHLSSGSATGKEWLMLFPGNSTSTELSRIDDVLGWNGFSGHVDPVNWYFPNITAASSDAAIDSSGFLRGTISFHYHAGGLEAASARAVLELTGQPANGETVEIDGKTYTFQTTLTDVDGNVQIGSTDELSRDNLLAAINLDAETLTGVTGPGVAYATSTTVHPSVEASALYHQARVTAVDRREFGADRYLFVRAKVGGTGGNAISISTTVANGSWGGKTTLEGGAATNTYGVGSGSDLDPPQYIPREFDMHLFFPDFGARPYPRGGSYEFSANGVEPNRMCLVWNHEVPFIAHYCGYDKSDAVSRVVIQGDILEPRVSADPYPEATFTWHGSTFSDVGIERGSQYVHHLTEFGFLEVSEDHNSHNGMDFHDFFDSRNQPRDDGTFDLDPIRIYGAFDVKGYLRKDVVGQQGFFQGPPHMVFDARYGKAFQVDYHTVIPWVTGAPVPFYGWPLDPQSFYSG